MDLFISILALMFQVLWKSFTSSTFALLFLLLFAIVLWQYKRVEEQSEALPHGGQRLYLESAVFSTLLGIAGGVVGSALLILLGIDLSRLGIIYLWVIAMLLMLINARFLCFAYAGGILSLVSLFTGYPAVDVAQVMGLVAVLHLIESFLIVLNGHFNPIPVYVKKNGSLVGGFNLQKFWPIPLVALIGGGITLDPGIALVMPDWWPLIKDYSHLVTGQSYTLLPVLAILGYGEITTTTAPRQRVRTSAGHLFLFSLVLLLLSIFSSRYPAFLPLAALFGPLGHELVIWLGMREESNRSPLYTSRGQGVMVLDVKPGTPAQQAGLLSGDTILSINRWPVFTHRDLEAGLNQGWGDLEIELIRDEKPARVVLKRHFLRDHGLTPVPAGGTRNYIQLREDLFFNLARKAWHRLKRIGA